MKAAQARVVLTGATGGIGRAVAARLLGAGASVMLVARSPARLAALSRELAAIAPPSASPRVAWHAADLNNPEAVEVLAQEAALWAANVLINNAGLPSFGRLTALSAEHIEQVLHTNLVAPIRLTQAMLPALADQPRAQIIQMGSALGRLGLPGFSVYSASKFGLRGFSEALRRELGDSTVRVQYLGPRTTRTAFNDAAVDAHNRATGAASDSPLRVANALLGLLESEAAESFIGFPECAAVRLNGLAPTLLDAAVGKNRKHLPPPRDAEAPAARWRPKAAASAAASSSPSPSGGSSSSTSSSSSARSALSPAASSPTAVARDASAGRADLAPAASNRR